MGIKAFFKKAFGDIKRSTAAQHEVDKANFEVARAESRARHAEAKAMGDPGRREAAMQAQRDAQIAEANKRRVEAESRITAAKEI